MDHDFDIALLDVNLDGRPSWPIATLIQERGVPVVFSTGYSESFARPAALIDVPSVAKPYETVLLLARLREAADAQQSRASTGY